MNARLSSKIETLTNVPATTSIVAGMEALRALSVRRVGLVNPYPVRVERRRRRVS